MKILQPGNALHFDCTGAGNGGGGCGAKLELTLGDLRYWPGVSTSSGWGESEAAVCFKCIACGAVTDIPRKRWPQNPNTLHKATTGWIHGGNQYVEPESDK